MGHLEIELLRHLASKYVWWKTPEAAMAKPARVIAQVMDLGGYADVQAMVEQVGNERLREVLINAEVGQFNPRSWHYWHHRLGLAGVGQVPDMPTRKLG